MSFLQPFMMTLLSDEKFMGLARRIMNSQIPGVTYNGHMQVLSMLIGLFSDNKEEALQYCETYLRVIADFTPEESRYFMTFVEEAGVHVTGAPANEATC